MSDDLAQVVGQRNVDKMGEITMTALGYSNGTTFFIRLILDCYNFILCLNFRRRMCMLSLFTCKSNLVDHYVIVSFKQTLVSYYYVDLKFNQRSFWSLGSLDLIVTDLELVLITKGIAQTTYRKVLY